METVTDILAASYDIRAKAPSKIDCPFCGKKSFSIKDDNSVGKCFHPDCEKVITAKGKGGRSYPKKKRTHVQTQGCTLAMYSKAKKLSEDFLKTCHISEISIQKAPALRIPYFTDNGLEGPIRHRINLEKGEVDNRFRWKNGSKPTLYGLWRLKDAEKAGYVVLVEGESDCHTLWFHGIPAIGLPGAKSWKEEWRRYFENIEKIYTIIEPDAGGEAVQRWLAKSDIRDKVFIVRLGEYEDASGLHTANPELFKQRWDEYVTFAIPWKSYENEKQRQIRIEQEKLCQDILLSPYILELFYETLRQQGIVGEEKIAKLLFLALTSRLLQKPVSMTVKGSSSGGKSFLVESVTKYFPESAYYELTAMSERALVYTEESFEHRFIIIFEAAGLQGDMGSYLVRSLISENRIKYEFVEKTSQGMRGRLIEKQGPTGFIMTTTATRLHPENETRILSVTVNDSRNQTKEIILSIAREHEEVDLNPWHALQGWLELSPIEVHIPFLERLAELIPPAGVRLRRDFATLKSLIQTHAILHQKSRKIEDGRLIADIEDYAVVRELVVEIMSEGLGAAVSPCLRETVEAVRTLIDQSKEPITNKKVGEKLNIDVSAASRRVRAAIAGGYLINKQEKKRQPADLKIGEPMPDDVELLPTASVLSDCMIAEEAKRSKAPSPDSSDGNSGTNKNKKPFLVVIGSDEQYEERAAIMEYDGGLELKKAEKAASTPVALEQ